VLFTQKESFGGRRVKCSFYDQPHAKALESATSPWRPGAFAFTPRRHLWPPSRRYGFFWCRLGHQPVTTFRDGDSPAI
jgi:hypothetical protein